MPRAMTCRDVDFVQIHHILSGIGKMPVRTTKGWTAGDFDLDGVIGFSVAGQARPNAIVVTVKRAGAHGLRPPRQILRS